MHMSDVPSNVHQVIKTLVPSSILNELSCFVFYDNHPAQSKFCDITICTKHGEIKEYYKREEVSSLFLDIEVSQIRILRNSKCELFYLLASKNEVIILSRKDELRVHKKVNNVDYYDINDSVCTGQACLKIVLKDDAVPLVFDDSFENLGEREGLNKCSGDDSLPILTQLQRKLTQAKYSIQCNEKTQKEFMELRKLTAFAAYKKLHPNLDDSTIGENYNEICEPLKLRSQKPSVTICNKKIVISFDVVNNNKKPLHEISAFLHTNKPSIVYTTKLFQHSHVSPFWNEIHEIEPHTETRIVVVVDLTELQYNTTSRVEFNGVISYKTDAKDFIMPFETVVISYSEVMGREFDILANEIDDVSILSVLATTKKFDLSLRIIGNDAPEISLSHMFCQYLEMDHVIGVENAVVHKKSPHHILNGVMIIFENDNTHCTSVAVYVRSDSQVLPLLHYIHETVPYRIVVTSQNQKITATIDSLKKYNEEIPEKLMLKLDYTSYASSMLHQTSMILEYLDGCVVKMNENKDSKVQSKIGKEINLFAQGLSSFKEFRSNLVVESLKGVKCLQQCEVKPVVDSGSMFLDNE